jgi:hypothetical protein
METGSARTAAAMAIVRIRMSVTPVFYDRNQIR